MELTAEQKRSQELLQQIIYKVWEDEVFKEELMENPLVAIEKATGVRVRLPKGKTLVVNDQTDGSVVYLNIPAEPNLDDLELSEDQLEAVAAGVWELGDVLGIPILFSTDQNNNNH